MERARTADETDREIAFHASGFIVKVEGSWTESALAQFRHFLHLRRLSPSEDELRMVLERAKKVYRDGTNHLYLCAAQPCCNQPGFDTSAAPLESLSRELGLPVSVTGCQGP